MSDIFLAHHVPTPRLYSSQPTTPSLSHFLIPFTILFHFVSALPASLSPPSLLSTPPSTNPSQQVQCVDHNGAWTAPRFVKEDCYVAVQNLYKQDYRWHPDVLFTFFSGGFAPPPSRRTAMVQTPRRYVESTCTLALVNLNLIARIDLPGRLPHGEEARDQATWREVYDVARKIEGECVDQLESKSRVGWGVVGQ
ncbi:MAG: hypothetical protein Q9222_004603 [Ikaeria aurantiellina]